MNRRSPARLAPRFEHAVFCISLVAFAAAVGRADRLVALAAVPPGATLFRFPPGVRIARRSWPGGALDRLSTACRSGIGAIARAGGAALAVADAHHHRRNC